MKKVKSTIEETKEDRVELRNLMSELHKQREEMAVVIKIVKIRDSIKISQGMSETTTKTSQVSTTWTLRMTSNMLRGNLGTAQEILGDTVMIQKEHDLKEMMIECIINNIKTNRLGASTTQDMKFMYTT